MVEGLGHILDSMPHGMSQQPVLAAVETTTRTQATSMRLYAFENLLFSPLIDASTCVRTPLRAHLMASSSKLRSLWLRRIERRGDTIRFVPEHLRNAEFDNDAAMRNAWVFGYLPWNEKTYELLLKLISDSVIFDPAMLGQDWAVPEELLTREVLDAASARCGAEQVTLWISRA